jgi:hypothetical protein
MAEGLRVAPYKLVLGVALPEVVTFTLPFLEICSHNLNDLGISFLNKK